MTKNEILEALKGNDCVTIIQEGNEVTISRNVEGLWSLKTFVGRLLYTDEELAKEISQNWDGLIDII